MQQPLRLLRAIAALWCLGHVVAQGSFVNYEDPQVKPIAVATLTNGPAPVQAFSRLLGMPNLLPPPARAGLSGADMDAFTAFIDTVCHPPNPEQHKTRVYQGNADPASGPLTGAAGGRRLFHELPLGGCEGRSCVHCHQLPDGSSNTLTEAFFVPGSVGGLGAMNPFETAALRNLTARELVLPGTWALRHCAMLDLVMASAIRAGECWGIACGRGSVHG